MSGENWIKACGTPQWGTQLGSVKPWLKSCACVPTWHAMLLIIGVDQCQGQERHDPSGDDIIPGAPGVIIDPSGDDYFTSDPKQPHFIGQKFVIRSSSAPGTTIHVPFDWTYLDNTCAGPFSASDTYDIEVGLDTNCAWRRLADFNSTAVPGQSFHVYIASIYPSSSRHPELYTTNEYAFPLLSRNVTTTGLNCVVDHWDPTTLVTAGLVNLRDLLSTLDTDFGAPFRNPESCMFFGPLDRTVFDYAPGILGGQGKLISDPPTTTEPAATTALYNSYLIAAKEHVFNRPVFTTPAGPVTTDDLLNFVVTYTNALTGHTIDGTHTLTDAYEADEDTQPYPELSGAGPDEVLDNITFVRNSYGNYNQKFKFSCQSGLRQFTVRSDHVYSSVVKVSQQWTLSNPIQVNPGAAGYVDLVPPDPSFTPIKYMAGEIMLNAGSPLTARILDRCGHFKLYNVVTSATNNCTMALIDNGGNDYTGPSLSGTTTQAAVSGIASFNDLWATGLGRNYSLRISGAGVSQSHNNNWYEFPIELRCNLAFQTLPTVHAGVPANILVDIVDAFGTVLNPTTNDNLTLSGGFTGSPSTVTPAAGTATFTVTFASTGTYTLSVVTSGTNYDGPGVGAFPAVTISLTVVP